MTISPRSSPPWRKAVASMTILPRRSPTYSVATSASWPSCSWPRCTAGVVLSAFAYAWYTDYNLAHARDAAFSVLVMAELFRAFGARSDTRTVWEVGLVSNLQLCVIVMASFALQLALHYLPSMQVLFGTTPLS